MNEVLTLTAFSMLEINSIPTHTVIGLNTRRQDITDSWCLLKTQTFDTVTTRGALDTKAIFEIFNFQ